MIKIEQVINFLECDIISATFTSKGLKYLSLEEGAGSIFINLRLINDLQNQSPEVKLVIDETLNFIETGRHNMPLDFTAFTEFQQNVFKVVSSIEPGKIATYKDIAVILGKPGGAQAVGNALGKNPVSYFLPTHRILPQKGFGLCRSGAGHLREKLLSHEGHDLIKLTKIVYAQRRIAAKVNIYIILVQ